MTPDEHQRERRDFWKAACVAAVNSDLEPAGERADYALESFDKRFPAPSAAAPVEPVANRVGIEWREPETFAQWDDVHKARMVDVAELASLRQKARLWDAVASGRIELRRTVSGIEPKQWWAFYGPCDRKTKLFPTAEEAVEAAIAAGALK